LEFQFNQLKQSKKTIMNNILPILKNNDQYQAYKQHNFFVEYLFAPDPTNSPIVVYGKDRGNLIEYSPSKSKEEDMKIKETAINNLKQIEVPFEMVKVDGNDLLYAQHEYASEKILDKEFLIKISEVLGSSSILIGIPIKGFLAATAKGKGENNFLGSIINMYDNPQTYPIFRHIFFVQNGEIEMMAVPKNSKKANTYSINGEFDKNNKIKFKVDIVNDTEDGIANQIQEAYQSILAKIPENPKKYNGKIDFHLSENIELTKSLENRIVKMANNISERGAVQIIGALIGEEFKIKFYYGNNKLISETIEKKPVQLKENIKNKNKKKFNKQKKWWKFW